MKFKAEDIYVVDDNVIMPDKWYVVVYVRNGEKRKFVYVKDIKEKGLTEETFKDFKNYQFSGFDCFSYAEHLKFFRLPLEEVELDALIEFNDMINDNNAIDEKQAKQILGKRLANYLTCLKGSRCCKENMVGNGL